ncbi:hypothetical protein [Haloarcula sebkhae]|uniref:Uncharacterized protein n=2 Tax=Haloarcula sebkhae TaxID=932660 RepID=A0ACC6VP81_9EURY|nr:hypothetical protein [Haloarcula sebkhae]GGK83397.1 hypothetical protein GCM10009067_39560 [Haloarcula sebkhae]
MVTSESVDLDDIVPVLYEERSYSTPLRTKAFHKLIYFIHKELSAEPEIESNIGLFWYKYGTCAQTSQSPLLEVVETGGGHETKLNESGVSTDLSTSAEWTVRDAVKRALERYYERGLEGITDLQYEDAPYQLQRNYRQLDKRIGSIKSSGDVNTTEFDRVGFRRLLNDFVQVYPTEAFPEHENELYHCYSILSERIDNPEATIGHLERVLDTFWSLFCVDLAESTATNASSMSVLSDLGIDEPHEAKEELREQIHEYDEDYLTVKGTSEVADEAAEAVMLSRLRAD